MAPFTEHERRRKMNTVPDPTPPDRPLLQAALDALTDATGLVGRGIGADDGPAPTHAQLREGHRTFEIPVFIQPRIDRTAQLDVAHAQLIEKFGNTAVLVTEYLTPALAEHCRTRQHQQFIDTAGNAFLRLPGLHVVIQGRPRPMIAQPRAATRPRAIATAAAQRIVFLLLCQPQYLGAPYRAIAQAAGVALGVVGRVLKDLAEQRYIVGGTGQWRFLEPERLFDKWVAFYPAQLRPKLGARRFTTANAAWWKGVNFAQTHARWGGEVAADLLTGLLQPAAVTVYVPAGEIHFFIGRNAMQYHWRADPRGEIEVLERFWTFDTPHDVLKGTAPAPLVYADLIATMDPRNREVAQALRKEALAPILNAT
jgi:hypothetical protein